MEDLLLKGVNVDDLVRVTRGKDELVVSEEMEVVSFVRVLTVNSEELEGSFREGRVLEGFLLVVLRVELIVRHIELNLFFDLLHLLDLLLLVLAALFSRLSVFFVH